MTVLIQSNVCITVPVLKCEHEKADDRIIFHLHHLVTKVHEVNTIVVATEDTDVVVSLLYHYGESWANMGLKHLWLNKGSGTKRKIHPIHSLVYDIGHDIVKYMPAAHALTGADTTSNVGTKDSLIKTAKNFKLLDGFGLSELSEEMFQKVEKCLVYCFASTKTDCNSFNELRVKLYNTYSKNFDFQKKCPARLWHCENI